MENKPTSLLNNSRFYVLMSTVLLSALLFFGVNLMIADSRLRYIRLQQFYGLAAILYWYAVLVLSAGSKLITKKPWVTAALFKRRALGVSVAYFAVLHFYLGFTRQLEGWSGIWLLPTTFKWSLLCAVFALSVLLASTALSVDMVVRVTKFSKWKWVQRFNYAAAVVIILHIWLIGSHAGSVLVQLIVAQALVVLFVLESLRLYKGLNAKGMAVSKAALIGTAVGVTLTAGLLLMKLYIPSYGESHKQHVQKAEGVEHAH